MEFETIYNNYSGIVFRKCLAFTNGIKDEAEDLTHDIFIKIFLSLSTFKNQSNISTWVYRITYNYCIDYTKKKKIIYSYNHLPDCIEEIDDSELFQIKVEKLKELLNKIHPEEKSILLMKYQDELSIKEICAILELKESAVKMKISRAKTKVIQLNNEQYI